MRYICENSSDSFIWGFEEPENSLEYSHVVDLARDFQKLYSKIAQIFLTTHSPAFTAFRQDNTACFRVFRTAEGYSDVGCVWPETGSGEERARLNIDMGFLRIEEQLHQEYEDQREVLEKLQASLTKIEEESRETQKPILLLEGKHDQTILEIAWEKCRPNLEKPFIFRKVDPAGGLKGGAGGATNLAKAIEIVHPDERRKVIAIFDRDKEGLNAFSKLSKNFQKWRGQDDIKIHINKLAYAVLLPIPPGREAYAERENLSIEFMFPDTVIEIRTEDGRGLSCRMPQGRLQIKNQNIEVRPDQMQQMNLGLILDGCREIVKGKDVFAKEIVPDLDAEHFQAFEALFEILDQILEG